MIIETFEKGTNFKKFMGIDYNIKKIEIDNNCFILTTEYNKDNIVLDTELYELRITY